MTQISVIVPAYNPGPYLREAVESVIAQTFTGWELIVVDDGSGEDLSYVEAMDSRIRMIRQENRGLSAARNAGVMVSSAPYIAFLDADDLWLPEKLERQLKALEADPSRVLCHTQMRFIDERGDQSGLGWSGEYETYEQLLDGCGVCVSSVVIRREILFACGLFDSLLRAVQDYDLWLKATKRGPMAAIKEPMTLYRLHGSNMSGNYRLIYAESREILYRHLGHAIREGRRHHIRGCRRGLRRVRRNAGLLAFAAAKSRLKRQEFLDAAVELGASVVMWPMVPVFGVAATLWQRASGFAKT